MKCMPRAAGVTDLSVSTASFHLLSAWRGNADLQYHRGAKNTSNGMNYPTEAGSRSVPGSCAVLLNTVASRLSSHLQGGSSFRCSVSVLHEKKNINHPPVGKACGRLPSWRSAHPNGFNIQIPRTDKIVQETRDRNPLRQRHELCEGWGVW